MKISKNPILAIRLQRANSWLLLADGTCSSELVAQETSHVNESPSRAAREHERFIFYWIAFNALYGQCPYEGPKERMPSEWPHIEKFLGKIRKMWQLDRSEGTLFLDNAIKQCWEDGRTIIEDYFLDHQYWKKQKTVPIIKAECERRWKEAEWERDTIGELDKFLEYSLNHLRVLRNQIMHGSASHGQGSRGYRDSLLPGLRFTQVMIRGFYDVSKTYGDRIGEKWEKPPYPRRGHPEHPRS